jgi:hypothetical protein
VQFVGVLILLRPCGAVQFASDPLGADPGAFDRRWVNDVKHCASPMVTQIPQAGEIGGRVANAALPPVQDADQSSAAIHHVAVPEIAVHEAPLSNLEHLCRDLIEGGCAALDDRTPDQRLNRTQSLAGAIQPSLPPFLVLLDITRCLGRFDAAKITKESTERVLRGPYTPVESPGDFHVSESAAKGSADPEPILHTSNGVGTVCNPHAETLGRSTHDR